MLKKMLVVVMALVFAVGPFFQPRSEAAIIGVLPVPGVEGQFYVFDWNSGLGALGDDESFGKISIYCVWVFLPIPVQDADWNLVFGGESEHGDLLEGDSLTVLTNFYQEFFGVLPILVSDDLFHPQ